MTDNICPYCSEELVQMTIDNDDEEPEFRYVCDACGYPFED